MAKITPGLVKEISALEEHEWHWNKTMAKSESALLVMDCHQQWCGPCETMWPTFQRIFLDTPMCEKRCIFVSADLDKFASQVEAILTPDSKINLDKQGCMPFFLMIRNGAVVKVVQGANVPGVHEAVQAHVPEYIESQGGGVEEYSRRNKK